MLQLPYSVLELMYYPKLYKYIDGKLADELLNLSASKMSHDGIFILNSGLTIYIIVGSKWVEGMKMKDATYSVHE